MKKKYLLAILTTIAVLIIGLVIGLKHLSQCNTYSKLTDKEIYQKYLREKEISVRLQTMINQNIQQGDVYFFKKYQKAGIYLALKQTYSPKDNDLNYYFDHWQYFDIYYFEGGFKVEVSTLRIKEIENLKETSVYAANIYRDQLEDLLKNSVAAYEIGNGNSTYDDVLANCESIFIRYPSDLAPFREFRTAFLKRLDQSDRELDFKNSEVMLAPGYSKDQAKKYLKNLRNSIKTLFLPVSA